MNRMFKLFTVHAANLKCNIKLFELSA